MNQILMDLQGLFDDKPLMKKIGVCVIVFWVPVAIKVIIAEIFDLETTNSLYALITLSIMFSTVLVLLIKIIIDYKEKHPILKKLNLLIAIIACAVIFLLFGIVYYLITGRMFEIA